MIKTLVDTEQYRSFLDDRKGDVIIQVFSTEFYGYKEFWWEVIVRANGRVDGGKGLDINKRDAAMWLIGVDEISLEDADEYLQKLAKRDVRNAK